MAILSGSEVVGVVGLAHADSDSIVANLAIDSDYQRQGLGGAALAAIVDHCSSVGSGRITLTVHPDNSVAAGLYERAGFSTTGKVLDGEPEWSLHLGR